MRRVDSRSSRCNSPGEALHVGASSVALRPPVPGISEITDTHTHTRSMSINIIDRMSRWREPNMKILILFITFLLLSSSSHINKKLPNNLSAMVARSNSLLLPYVLLRVWVFHFFIHQGISYEVLCCLTFTCASKSFLHVKRWSPFHGRCMCCRGRTLHNNLWSSVDCTMSNFWPSSILA